MFRRLLGWFRRSEPERIGINSRAKVVSKDGLEIFSTGFVSNIIRRNGNAVIIHSDGSCVQVFGMEVVQDGELTPMLPEVRTTSSQPTGKSVVAVGSLMAMFWDNQGRPTGRERNDTK